VQLQSKAWAKKVDAVSFACFGVQRKPSCNKSKSGIKCAWNLQNIAKNMHGHCNPARGALDDLFPSGLKRKVKQAQVEE
jgi:hypothetical protein